jgi:menaquinone-9 beta-reductase
MRHSEPLIIGAGPAGTAAAIALAQAGTRATMIEARRETADALCGGFLSWATLERLARLGVDVDGLGGATIGTMRMFAGRHCAELALPAPAMGLSRLALDMRLQALAIHNGVALERGISVRAIDATGAINLSDGARLQPESCFIATGKHDLRGLGRERAGESTIGLRVRLSPHPKLTAMIGAAIELHLFAGGYAGLVLQEGGAANLCMAVRKARLTEAGGDPQRLLHLLANECPALGDRLAYMDALSNMDAIAAIPYGYVERETRAGLFRLGDQAACIPSLAGEGIGIALESGMQAAAAWSAKGAAGAQPYQARFGTIASGPVARARLLWRSAERPGSAAVMVGLARLAPSLARFAARLTRLSN